MERRGVGGRIEPFRDKFPSGMKVRATPPWPGGRLPWRAHHTCARGLLARPLQALGDYIHSKGLLFGVYSDAGNSTCEGYPGSWGYERLVSTRVGRRVVA